VAPTACNQLPGLLNAQWVEINALDFPEDGVATTTITSTPSSTLEIIEYDACVSDPLPGSGTPLSRVETILNISGRGWQPSATFPLSDSTPAVCTASETCFADSPQDFLLIESAAAPRRGILTFTLRRALPAPLLQCDPSLFPFATFPTSISPYYGAQIPLPPLTEVSTGYGTVNSVITYLCSGETAEQITSFMQKQLPLSGWDSVTLAGKQLWKTHDYSPTLYIWVHPVTDPHKWAIEEYFSGTNFG
jgi:hypothetical protein